MSSRTIPGEAVVEGIAVEPVTAWMRSRLPELKPPLAFSRIAGGNSNLTYRCEDQAGALYVLRRPPLGHVLATAHDMAREYRIVSALTNSKVPVAPVHGLCEDDEVNGAPFYVMSFVAGAVLHGPADAQPVPGPERVSISEHVVEVLADLHKTDIDAVGLGRLARKDGYIERQLKRWTSQWEGNKTHEVPEMDEAGRLLRANVPLQKNAAIVHGDYRLGNMLIDSGRINALVDWELCTLGDPLADFGYLLNSWAEPGDDTAAQRATGVGGFLSRSAMCDRYEALTGQSLANIGYYRAFSCWRMAAINQSVYKRYLEGAMGSDQGDDLEAKKRNVIGRAQAALALLVI